MSNIINKDEFINNKIGLAVLSPILTFFMFFIMGNWSMVTINTSGAESLSKVTVLENCFSMSVLDIVFLYLIITFIVGIFFRDKDTVLQGIVNKEIDRNVVFFTKISLCLAPLLIAIVINLVVKLITYFVIKGSILNVVGITIGAFFMFTLYILVLTILILSVIFMLNIAVKEAWIATLIPPFIYNGIILIFGMGPFFISTKFEAVSKFIEPISNSILDSLQLIFLNSALPTQDLGRQYLVLAILFVISLLIFYIGYVMLDLLNKKNIKKPYVFSPVRHIFYLTLAAIIGFYTVCGLGYIYLISETTYEYNEGLLYINLISFAVIIVLFAAFNIIYKYRTAESLEDINDEANNIEQQMIEEKTINEIILPVSDEEFNIEEDLDNNEEIKKLFESNIENIEECDDEIMEGIQYEYEIQVESNDKVEASSEGVEEILLDDPIKECVNDQQGIIEEIQHKEPNAQEETLAERIYANYIASQQGEK